MPGSTPSVSLQVLCAGVLVHSAVALDKPPPKKLFEADFCSGFSHVTLQHSHVTSQHSHVMLCVLPAHSHPQTSGQELPFWLRGAPEEKGEVTAGLVGHWLVILCPLPPSPEVQC